MRSVNNLSRVAAGVALTSEDIVEYHAARLLLVLLICGVKEHLEDRRRIDGLTKLAKLDFFVRYPDFLAQVAKELGRSVDFKESVPEPKMIRYHYGPWDHRYYQVLPYLEARSLIKILKDPKSNQFKFYLTKKGIEVAQRLSTQPSFEGLVKGITEVKDVVGPMSGNQLKQLIYKIFKHEVAERTLGESIT